MIDYRTVLLYYSYWSIFIQILEVDSETCACNVTERIMTIQGQFEVIQGR